MTGWYAANLVLVQGTLINLLLALSLQVPFRFGVFSFAGIGCFGIGAYTAAILTINFSAPAAVSILAGTLLAGIVGGGLALVLARLGGLYLGMATIAFDLIITVIANNGGELTGGIIGLFGVITELSVFLVLAIVLAVVVALALSERGSSGRRIEAVREDPELAASTGTNVRRYRQYAFIVSGLLGGLAGSIAVLLRTTIGPANIGFSLVVLALTMMIIGGTRSWAGALIGALIFTWLPRLLEPLGDWQHLVYGLLVALAAIYVPGGLYGVLTDAYRGWERRRRGAATSGPDDPVPPAPDLAEPQPTGSGAHTVRSEP